MDNVLVGDSLDRKIAAMEEKFRSVLESSLGSFLECKVPVAMSRPARVDFKELKSSLPGDIIAVKLTATDGGPGQTVFVLSKDGAATLADMLLMGDGKAVFEHDEHLEPVRDLFKEVMSGFATDLSTLVGHRVAFDDIKAALMDLAPSDFLGAGWIVSRFDIGLARPVTVFRLVSNDFYEACYPEVKAHAGAPQVDTAEDAISLEAQKEMGLVLDIELPIAIELGRTSMLIRDIVKLAPGSIVELDKLSGEPVDLLVNGKLFARGEVVVVDENFGVRVTELASPADYARVRSN